MGAIHCLEAHVIDQIAAGEVIEDSSSIVRELLENALDAGADQITLHTEGSTGKLIVADNGEGIMKEDLARAILPHATSKLRVVEDLFSLSSLGFRGEALASIGAVARLSIHSGARGSVMPYAISVVGGKASEVIPIPHGMGTTVFVEDLFFNIPARKAFLPSWRAQKNAIKKVLFGLAMSFPHVQLRWIDQGAVELDLVRQSYEQRVKTLMGEYFTQMLYLVERETCCSVEGFISRPTCYKSHRKNQLFVVNHRPIYSSMLSQFVLNGYGHLLGRGAYPLCILHITVDPSMVDMNVHPQKKELRFMKENQVQELIEKMIRQAFTAPKVAPICTHRVPFSFPSSPVTASSPPEPSLLPKEIVLHSLIMIGRYTVVSHQGAYYLVDLLGLKRTLLYQQWDQDHVNMQKLMFPMVCELTLLEEETIEQDAASWGFQIRRIGMRRYAVDAIPAQFSEEEARSFLYDWQTMHHVQRRAIAIKMMMKLNQKTFYQKECEMLLKHITNIEMVTPSGDPVMVLLSEERCKKIMTL